MAQLNESRTLRRRTIQAGIAALLFLFPVVVFAEEEPRPYPECTKKPSQAEITAARGAFDAGMAAYNEADYGRAATYWEDAYRRDCTQHTVLSNIARAHELNGQKRHAILALETLLVREPNLLEKEQVVRRVDVLKSQLVAEKPVEPEPPPVKEAPPPKPPQMEHRPPPSPVMPEPSSAASNTGKRPIFPLVTAGSGAVAGLVGGVLLATATAQVADALGKCPGHECASPDRTKAEADALANDANAARERQRFGGILTGVGLGVCAAGLIWYVLSPPRIDAPRGEPAATLIPVLGQGLAALQVRGRF